MALAAELETGQLPPAEAAQLEAAVGTLPWGRAVGAPPHPDAFRYELDLPDEPGRGTAVLEEGEMVGALDLLRRHLQENGTLEPARRRGGGA
jgi:hypothetical protein